MRVYLVESEIYGDREVVSAWSTRKAAEGEVRRLKECKEKAYAATMDYHQLTGTYQVVAMVVDQESETL